MGMVFRHYKFAGSAPEWAEVAAMFEQVSGLPVVIATCEEKTTIALAAYPKECIEVIHGEESITMRTYVGVQPELFSYLDATLIQLGGVVKGDSKPLPELPRLTLHEYQRKRRWHQFVMIPLVFFSVMFCVPMIVFICLMWLIGLPIRFFERNES
ncbi:MAG: hypothetical protein ACRC8S_09805 [Fimbriiglobus sp.]